MGHVCLLGRVCSLDLGLRLNFNFLKILVSYHSNRQTPTVHTYVIERKRMQPNVETLNCLELVVHLVSKPASFIKKLKDLSCPVDLLQFLEVPWHTVWEP